MWAELGSKLSENKLLSLDQNHSHVVSLWVRLFWEDRGKSETAHRSGSSIILFCSPSFSEVSAVLYWMTDFYVGYNGFFLKH